MALLILALLQRIFLMSSLMLLLVWLIFFMVLIKLLPILGTISGKTVKLMVLALICLGNNRLSTNLASHFFDLVIGKILTSRLSLSKHLAHNLGNLLLLGKIGVFHNRRNASSRLLLLISKHLILCLYRVFRILAGSRRLNATNLFLSLIFHLGNLFLIVQLHFSKLFLILKSGVNHTSRGSISTSTLPSIKLRKCSSKIITSILSFISGRLATKSNQIKQLIRNGRSASLQ